jgi:hypothetical protein
MTRPNRRTLEQGRKVLEDLGVSVQDLSEIDMEIHPEEGLEPVSVRQRRAEIEQQSTGSLFTDLVDIAIPGPVKTAFQLWEKRRALSKAKRSAVKEIPPASAPETVRTLGMAGLASWAFFKASSFTFVVFGPFSVILSALWKGITGFLGWRFISPLAIDTTSKVAVTRGVVLIVIPKEVWYVLAPLMAFASWWVAFEAQRRWQARRRIKHAIQVEHELARIRKKQQHAERIIDVEYRSL